MEVVKESNIWLLLIDIQTGIKFKRYFNTEFERDKFKNKLAFSKHIRVLEVYPCID